MFCALFSQLRRALIMNKNWTIVGISGCTNSGKTTLATSLRNHFLGTVVVNQDHYFRPDDSKEHILIPELNHKNWERLEAVNWDALMQYVTQSLSSEPVSANALLIVEGHIIFNYPPLEKLFHKKYFIKLDKEECYRRRITRVYDPPDIPGYFEKCVWPMYLSNLKEIEMKSSDVMYLNGTDTKESIYEKVLNDLKTFMDL